MHTMARCLLGLIGVLFCLLATRSLLWPMEFAAQTGMLLPTAGALAEVRAAYTGFFVVLAGLLLRGALKPEATREGVGLLGLLLSIFTAARMVGLVVDGVPETAALRFLAVEAIGATSAVWLWFRLGRLEPG